MTLHITVIPNLSRRAAAILVYHDGPGEEQISLESHADLAQYASGEAVTKVGTYTVGPAGVTVIDYTPPLGMPVFYRATAKTETADSEVLEIPHDDYIWIKGKRCPNGPIGLLATEAPQFLYDADVHSFFGMSEKTSGLGLGMSGVRHYGAVSVSVYTWTFEEARRMRALVRDNPICVQWPGYTDDAVTVAPWYLLGAVTRVPLGPPSAGQDIWTLELTPVVQSVSSFGAVSASYDKVAADGWPTYNAMREDSSIRSYDMARAAAAALGGPPDPAR